MSKHSHSFVENYDGMVGFGFDRETNENTLIYCLQKFSDDALAKHLVAKLSDAELESLFDTMMLTLKKHLTEPEYHALYLKDDDPHG